MASKGTKIAFFKHISLVPINYMILWAAGCIEFRYFRCDKTLKETEMNGKKESLEVKNPQAPILFVDDDPIAHKIVEKSLRDWDITCVHSAEEALRLLNKKNITIVITDIKMPGMNGIDLLKEIKRSRGIIQVILITASEDIEHLLAALEAGASDFLLKPIDREKIEDALEIALTKIIRWKTTMRELFQKKKHT